MAMQTMDKTATAETAKQPVPILWRLTIAAGAITGAVFALMMLFAPQMVKLLAGIAPVLATAGLLRVIWVANSIDVIFVMTGGGPGYATHTLPLYAFIKARQNLDFGYGSAIAVSFTLLLGVFVVFYIARTMREVER